MSDESIGVYLHVPFCERVCPYCDFPVVAARSLGADSERTYVDALLSELACRAEDFAGLSLASIYLGGGTPALLRPDSVARLIEAVRAAFPLPSRLPAAGDAGDTGRPPEVTLEANPSTLERDRLPGFLEAGVNRLSLGIQSFDDAILKRLGRAHRAGEGRASLRAAREAGFTNLSLDLIVAVPGQDLAQVEADLDEALSFEPEHVSAYALAVEPGTPYARGVNHGILVLPDEDLAVAMLEAIPARLGAAGIEAYEISSHARPGFEAVHNRRYWERLPVLGLGMGAWSVEVRTEAAPYGARQRNPASLPEYLDAAGRPLPPEAVEQLDEVTARGEAMFLGLRTRRGVSAQRFAAEFGGPPRRFYADELTRLAEAGLVREQENGDVQLSHRGRLLSDTVFEAFVGAD